MTSEYICSIQTQLLYKCLGFFFSKLIVTSGYSYGGTTVIEEWDDEKGIWMKRPDTLVRGGQRHAYLSVDISFVAAVGGECIAKS